MQILLKNIIYALIYQLNKSHDIYDISCTSQMILRNIPYLEC